MRDDSFSSISFQHFFLVPVSSVIFKIVFLWEWVSEWVSFHLVIHSINAHHSLGQATLKPGSRNSVQLSHTGGRDQLVGQSFVASQCVHQLNWMQRWDSILRILIWDAGITVVAQLARPLRPPSFLLF